MFVCCKCFNAHKCASTHPNVIDIAALLYVGYGTKTKFVTHCAKMDQLGEFLKIELCMDFRVKNTVELESAIHFFFFFFF